jgi:8-oxo-dGTP pyrophosphatase MutT (NUDIX family)
VEAGETEEGAAERETLEETGIRDIKIISGFREEIKYYFKARYNVLKNEKKAGPFIFKTVVFFLAETKTKDVKISFEHIGYIWLEYEKAIKRATYKNAKEILRKANNYICENKL